VIYLPNPAVGVRGIHFAIVTALGGAPAHHTAALIPQTAEALAAEHHERGKTRSSAWTRPTCSPTSSWRPSEC